MFTLCAKTDLHEINFINVSDPSQREVAMLRFCKFVIFDKCLISNKDLIRELNLTVLVEEAICGGEVLEAALYSLALILCTVIAMANIMAIVVIARHKSLQTTTNRIILSLAASDLLLGLTFYYSTILNLLILRAKLLFDFDSLDQLLRVRNNYIICLIMDGPGLIFTSMMASILTLLLIATEKYIAVFYPYKYPVLLTNKKVHITVLVIWVISTVVGVLPLLGWNKFTGMCSFVERTSYSYLVLWASICITSAIIITFIYLRIFLAARKHIRQIHNQLSSFQPSISHTLHDGTIQPNPSSNHLEPPESYYTMGHMTRSSIQGMRGRLSSSFTIHSLHGQIPLYKPTLKAVKTMCIILGGFYICWMPFLIYLLAIESMYNSIVLYTLGLLASFNSIFNPLVYSFRNKAIRQGVGQMCCRCCDK